MNTNSDMNLNMGRATIETNRELAAILSNFSDEFIEAMFQEAMMYKFRPFQMPLPNYPYIFESQFASIMQNYTGNNPDAIKQRREDTYLMIIRLICNSYNLSMAGEISYEHLWPLCYKMYQLFVSEFSNVLVEFFTNYINGHIDMILGTMSEEQKTIKSNYSKILYADPTKIIVYENIDYILDVVSSMDINFDQLVRQITDADTVNIITSYIADNGDVYKNFFASYIRDPITKTDIITSIKVNFVKSSVDSIKENFFVSPTKPE